MSALDFNQVIELIRKEDGRYSRQAYAFIREGLDQTVKQIRQQDAARARRSLHVSGRELSEGLRDFALDRFGPMAKTVLNEWGIHRSDDFGEIVYNLIDYNIFSKTEADRREDFSGVFEFDDAFVKPFLPRCHQAARKPVKRLKAEGK
ncbi:hypothetical protein OpiT1DRAFT_02025 [Opitutaceae bacterium TAV1]|nr:hypothetical protein OPIT5_04965 [Opitutaceae bacterium TAV5]EIP97579.1 hypothetical protein OpiT1DRAFT_02025 [Opitutaceae bacterium TAV1]